jgi:hypothetical protein
LRQRYLFPMVNTPLNLPEFNFSFKQENNKIFILDEIRHKYLILTPEEWVRQNFVKYMVVNLGYPSALISLEMPFSINNTDKRSDIAIYNREGNIVMLVECKAPKVKITQKTFDQAAVYNLKLKARYFIVTNGLVHYCCKVDYVNNKWDFVSEIPEYKSITYIQD